MNQSIRLTLARLGVAVCTMLTLALTACGTPTTNRDGSVPARDGGTTVTRCAAPNMMCGTTCVNTQVSNANCGMCGRACTAGMTCRAGMCAAAMSSGDAGATCPAMTTRCGTRCVSTATDASNCGRCGNRCPAGQACRAGACAAPPAMCAMGEMMCGAGMAARCADTQFDDGNCGMCGNACRGPSTCLFGNCECFGDTCNGRCTDTTSDSANCGACGTACAADEICSEGACQQVTCRYHGGACTAAADCCGAMLCEGSKCACRRGTESCVDSLDCCGPGLCTDGVCNDDSYLGPGDVCTNSLQCRGALFCVDGTCQ